MRRTWSVLSSWWLFLALPALAQDAGVAAGQAPSAAAELTGQVDQLFARRDQPQVPAQLTALQEKALAAHPRDYGLLWRDARWLFWQADGTAGDAKKDLARRGAEVAERALEQNPQGPEGHYYAGVCWGAYAQGVGVLKALSEGLEGRFVHNIDFAIEKAPQLQDGGPLIAKGRYYYELPWPKRNLNKSEEMLREALKLYPHNLRARYYLAETMLREGHAKDAQQTLAPIPTASEAYDPPEARRVKSWVPALKARIEEKLK